MFNCRQVRESALVTTIVLPCHPSLKIQNLRSSERTKSNNNEPRDRYRCAYALWTTTYHMDKPRATSHDHRTPTSTLVRRAWFWIPKSGNNAKRKGKWNGWNSCPLNDCIDLKTDVGTDLTIIKLFHHLLSGFTKSQIPENSRNSNRTKSNQKWQNGNTISEQHPPTSSRLAAGRSHHYYALPSPPIHPTKSQHQKISKNSQKYTKRLLKYWITVH
jgi:hypothetical protein